MAEGYLLNKCTRPARQCYKQDTLDISGHFFVNVFLNLKKMLFMNLILKADKDFLALPDLQKLRNVYGYVLRNLQESIHIFDGKISSKWSPMS